MWRAEAFANFSHGLKGCNCGCICLKLSYMLLLLSKLQLSKNGFMNGRITAFKFHVNIFFDDFLLPPNCWL